MKKENKYEQPTMKVFRMQMAPIMQNSNPPYEPGAKKFDMDERVSEDVREEE